MTGWHICDKDCPDFSGTWRPGLRTIHMEMNLVPPYHRLRQIVLGVQPSFKYGERCWA